MPPRAAITILYIGAARSVRADFAAGAGGELLSSDERPAGSGDPAAAATELLKSGARPAPKTFVFLENAWSQTVDLPAAASAGLNSLQLERALAFELEPVSGNRPAESAVAAVPIGTLTIGTAGAGHTRYLVTQISVATRDAIAQALAAAGTRLAGIAHPGGIGGNDALRMEVFEQVTFCINLQKRESTRAIAARPGSRLWEQEIRTWLAENAAGAPVLWRGRARAISQLPEAGEMIHDEGPLALDADLYQWMRECAIPAILDSPARVPMIAPPARERARLNPAIAGGVLCTLLAAACVFDYLQLSARVAGSEKEMQQIADAALKSQKTRTAMEALAKQAAELNKKNQTRDSRLRYAEAEWKAQRERLPALVRATSTECPEGVLATSISSDAGGILQIKGAAVESAAVDSFVADLAAQLGRKHFAVQPAQLRESWNEDAGRFFEFTITVAPVAAAPAPPGIGVADKAGPQSRSAR